MKRNFGGRPCHNFWEVGNFIPVQEEGKKVAYCSICKKYLKNVSKVRLQMHKKHCQLENSISSEIVLDSDSESNTTNLFIDSNANLLKSNSIGTFSQSDVSSSFQAKQQKKDKPSKTQNFKIQSFFDNIIDKDQVQINEALMKFFCGCNVPFEAVESDYFIDFMKILRPAYKPPTKELLSNSLLHNLHTKLIMDSTLINCDGILMVKEILFHNSKQIVTFVKTVQGKTFYLKSWEYSHNLEEIIKEALHIVKTKYSMTIYSVITDQDYQTLKINEQNELWFLNCNLLFIVSLEKVLFDKDFTDKVRHLLIEFLDLKEDLLKRDGATIKLSDTTAFANLRDMYASCKKNLAAMRQIIGEGVCKLKRVIVDILFDETFEQNLQNLLDLYELICLILNKCEDPCTIYADIVEEWLKLESLNNNIIHRIQD